MRSLKVVISLLTMVLSGLAFSSWQAWLTGIYFVKRPWGLPYPTGLCCHPFVLYAFTLNIISYVFWVDLEIKFIPISKGLSLTEKILTKAVILVGVVFDLYFRFNFYRLNIPLTELLRTLEQPKYKPLTDSFRKCWKTHKIFLWILTLPRYALTFTLVYASFQITASYPDSEFILSRYCYFALFTLFTAVPNVTSVIFSYDLIVITTFYTLWTFEDYCAHLEDHIYKGFFVIKKYSVNPTPSLNSLQIPVNEKVSENGYNGRKKSIFCSVTPNEFRNLRRLSDIEEGKGFERISFDCFVERFDTINSLASKYDYVIGPIILGVVVRCVFSIVHAVNALVLGAGKQYYLRPWYHILLLLVEASQLIVLKLGTEIQSRISYWKGKLSKACLLTTASVDNLTSNQAMQNSTLDSEDFPVTFENVEYDSQAVKDLVNYVCSWDWKLSAAGIFDINNRLFSGIVSTTLTYVIILFQLNLTDPGPETKQFSDPALHLVTPGFNSSLANNDYI